MVRTVSRPHLAKEATAGQRSKRDPSVKVGTCVNCIDYFASSTSFSLAS